MKSHSMIAKRKRTDQVVRDSKERYRHLAESNVFGFVISDLGGRVNEANDAFLKMVGYSREDIEAGRVNWKSMTPPEFQAADIRAIQELQQTGTCAPFEKEFIRKDEGRVPVMIGCAFLEGSQESVVGFVFDLTRRERAEESLRKSEAYVAEAQRLSHTGGFGWVVSSGEISWSRETFRIFEYDPATKPTVELILQRTHPDDAALVRQTIERASRDGKDFDFEHRLLMPDGSIKCVRIVGHAERDKSGEHEFIGAVMDVTAAKEAEERIRQNERELRITLETIPTSVVSSLPDGSVDFVSQSWLDYLGCSREEMLGWGWMKTTHPEDLDRVLNNWQEALAAGEPLEIEARFRQADGRYRWFLGRTVPLRDEKGNIIKWYAAVHDIEDRKRAEQELRASEQVARGQVEALAQSLDVLATAPAPDKFIGQMLGTICRQLNGQSVALWLFDETDESLVLRFAVEGENLAASDSHHPFVHDPAPWKENREVRDLNRAIKDLIFAGAPVVLEDFETDPRVSAAERESSKRSGTRKALGVPVLASGKVKGVISIRHGERPPYRREEIELMQALAHQVMLALRLTELAEQSRRAAILEERNRMARDIHDTLAQGFTGVIMQLEAAEKAIEHHRPRQADEHLRRAGGLARKSLSEARRSVHALRPQALKGGNFWDALQGMIKSITVGTALHPSFKVRGKVDELPPIWQENLLHIGQEALANTIKYAHASKFGTRLMYDPKELRLEFSDDGDGFKPQDRHDGRGLAGMQERVEQMGGELKITSSRGKGTKISVVLPCNGESML
jgi:PAS domain S-box-containing protein